MDRAPAQLVLLVRCFSSYITQGWQSGKQGFANRWSPQDPGHTCGMIQVKRVTARKWGLQPPLPWRGNKERKGLMPWGCINV